jgi:hypothetical protein
MGAFVAAEMTPQLFASAVKMAPFNWANDCGS